MTGFFEESQDGESKIRQCGKNFAQAGTTQIVTVFVPPSVFDEVQGVLDLPVVTHQFLKIGRPHLRRIDARDEVASVVRKKCVRRIEHIAIHTQNDLTIRDVQLFAKVLRVVDVRPDFANFNASFFLLYVTFSGSPTSENAYFTASNASP